MNFNYLMKKLLDVLFVFEDVLQKTGHTTHSNNIFGFKQTVLIL